MKKKDVVKNYFENIKMPALPITNKEQNEPTQPEAKVYKTHKIYDNPESIATDVSSLIEITPDEIKLWKYKDRPENELGDLDDFSKVLKKIGQLQPGIVRLSQEPGPKYELIVGERRWRACKLAGIPFQAKLVSYTDTESGLAQAAENKNRQDLSDYARGINYSRQIDDGILTQSDLAEKLGTTRQQISRLMSYKEIPAQLIEAIGDMTKVSPRTAEEIKFICKKDPDGLNILLGLADKLRSGIGYESLRKNYEKSKSSLEDGISNSKVLSKDGRHLFTWRKDGNGNLSISFPKDIRNVLDPKKAERDFAASIEQQIKLKLSPAGDS